MKSFLKKYWLRIVILLSAIAFFAVFLLTFILAGSIDVRFSENRLDIKAYYLSGEHFAYTFIDDINDYTISITQGFTDGEPTSMGVEKSNIKAGRFKNATLGEYMLFRYNKVKRVIVLKNKSSDFSVVFNLKSENLTQEFFDRLLEVV